MYSKTSKKDWKCIAGEACTWRRRGRSLHRLLGRTLRPSRRTPLLTRKSVDSPFASVASTFVHYGVDHGPDVRDYPRHGLAAKESAARRRGVQPPQEGFGASAKAAPGFNAERDKVTASWK
jgi:hypothetical protein